MSNMIIVTGTIENHGDVGFIGWVDRMPGVVVQGKTESIVKTELYKSIKVKIAYDYNLKIDKIEGKEINSIDDLLHIVNSTDSEKRFELQI